MIHNLPKTASEYRFVVAREIDGDLWYWGAYNDWVKAHDAAVKINGVVLSQGWEIIPLLRVLNFNTLKRWSSTRARLHYTKVLKFVAGRRSQFVYKLPIDKWGYMWYNSTIKRGDDPMRDYFKRIRCHDRFNRLYCVNKTTRQRAKRELKKYLTNGWACDII